MALAGLGGAAVRGHLPALARFEAERGGLHLVAAADPDAGRRAAAAAGLRRLPMFDSTETMLDRVPSDLLVIATEPAAHARLAALAVERGLHVLCEKPLTVTREQHQLVASSYRGRPVPALVTVNQYRHAAEWRRMWRWARMAARLRLPFTLDVAVERTGTDRHAASPWRNDIATSGGALADHGVHFLALGWTISGDLEVLDGLRMLEGANGERAAATVRVASGRLTLNVSTAAAARHTRVELRLPSAALRWSDETVALAVGGTRVRRWSSRALSDRRYVDALYLPLYRDLANGLADRSWRTRRTTEALSVGRSLVELIERAEPCVAPLLVASHRCAGQP